MKELGQRKTKNSYAMKYMKSIRILSAQQSTEKKANKMCTVFVPNCSKWPFEGIGFDEARDESKIEKLFGAFDDNTKVSENVLWFSKIHSSNS
jgi:hypothetical protein